MRRVTAACGSMEAKFPTKMEKKDFDQQMDNINRGYQTTLSFVDESGATGNGGDYGIMPQMCGDQANTCCAVEVARKSCSRTRCPFRRRTAW